ncbi:FtsX-like permease family protein [Kozakia baliensis]|uniref:cell division protein FtsX n=1 Tax=Kozakia baliensis TaxID=153496 RepID=UPI00345C54A5
MRKPIPDGLRLAGRDKSLGAVVAAMSALAALALGGWVAARSLSAQWEAGAARQVTIEIPDDKHDAHAQVLALLPVLRASPAVEKAEEVPPEKLHQILAPWLGKSEGAAIDLPAVISLTRRDAQPETDLAAIVRQSAPDAVIEENMRWGGRLRLLGQSLQACAWLAVSLAAAAAVAVTALSVRMTLAARRIPVEILHGLGATDGHIARRIARHSSRLGLAGGVAGAFLAWGMLTVLARLAMPFTDHVSAESIWPEDLSGWWQTASHLPQDLVLALASVPFLAWLIGWSVAQISVRRWLRRLP